MVRLSSRLSAAAALCLWSGSRAVRISNDDFAAADADLPRRTGTYQGLSLDKFELRSGFVPVPLGEGAASAELFTLFVKQENYNAASDARRPVVLWLNGGPGCSSLGGFFMGVGPMFLDRCWQRGKPFCGDNEECKSVSGKCRAKLVENPHSWHKQASVIFIESPPAVGFSKTADGQLNIAAWRSGAAPESPMQPVGQELLGRFHARALEQIVGILEAKHGLAFTDIYIAGESFAGIYLGHMVLPLLESSLKERFGGVFVGNPKLSVEDRLDATLPALVNRGVVPAEDFEKVKELCPNGLLSQQVDFREKVPTPCTKEWLRVYDHVAAGITKPNRGGVSWYNADYKCELCKGQACAPQCFDTSEYERLLNNMQFQFKFGVIKDRMNGVKKWEFCTDVSKWVSDVPMVERPQFLQDPRRALELSGKPSLRFWLFSGDADLESLHEVSALGMERSYGEPAGTAPWTEGEHVLGDFTRFSGSDDARLIRMKGAGHIPPYYATAATSELLRRFLANDAPREGEGKPCFRAPVVGREDRAPCVRGEEEWLAPAGR